MNKILFSIIIPYSGRFNFVKEAISSVYSQNVDLDQIEIIAINDPDSERNTEGRLRKIYPNIRYLDNNEKEGPGGKRNTGIKVARGRYLVFLDSDDQLKPGYLDIMSQILKRDKNIGAVVCFSGKLFSKDFPVHEKILRLALSYVQDFALIISFLFNNKYLIPSSFYLCQMSHMMFRKIDINKMRFNYDYRRGGEDWDFVYRLTIKKKIKILPKRLLIFRYSLISSTYTKINILTKWKSYLLLDSRLPLKLRNTFFHKLFLLYINFFKN